MSGGPGMHIEILSTPQRKAVKLLGKALTDSNFYLAGGTALSLKAQIFRN